MKTPLTETLGQEAMAKLFTSRISLGRLAEPEEVAKVVVFLLSDVPAYMSGSVSRSLWGVLVCSLNFYLTLDPQVVNIDGGWL